VKQRGEKPTDSQEIIIAKLAELEAGCALVTSVEEAERALAARHQRDASSGIKAESRIHLPVLPYQSR
jgi:hypothetical protein